MEGIFHQAIALTNAFNLWLILTIFAANMIGEFGFGVPYLMETIWLLIGYHAIGGTISPESVFLFCVISLIGREVGAGLLYKISGYGSSPLLRFFQKLAQEKPGRRQPLRLLKGRVAIPLARLVTRLLIPQPLLQIDENGEEIVIQRKPFCPSTFNVFLGRFCWLKIPITVNLGMVKMLRRLVVGVGLFSFAWDGLYISLGIFGAGRKINSLTMLACTIGGFILVNATIYFIRHYRASRRLASTAQVTKCFNESPIIPG